jgi:hypothetical protein
MAPRARISGPFSKNLHILWGTDVRAQDVVAGGKADMSFPRRRESTLMTLKYVPVVTVIPA